MTLKDLIGADDDEDMDENIEDMSGALQYYTPFPNHCAPSVGPGLGQATPIKTIPVRVRGPAYIYYGITKDPARQSRAQYVAFVLISPRSPSITKTMERLGFSEMPLELKGDLLSAETQVKGTQARLQKDMTEAKAKEMFGTVPKEVVVSFVAVGPKTLQGIKNQGIFSEVKLVKTVPLTAEPLPPTPGPVAQPAPPTPKKSGCFIATAAYGTPLAPEIDTLRDFRDERLMPSPLGRAFVKTYYTISPPIAAVVAQVALFRKAVRAVITPLVRRRDE